MYRDLVKMAITAQLNANKSLKAGFQKRGIAMYEDKTLVCKECGNEFVFTAGEQEFYAERGFQNEPQRCKACRDAKKAALRGPKQYFDAVVDRQKSHSSRKQIARFTAASASQR